MLLCVDVGNTQIALGVYSDGDGDEVRPPLVRDWRMRTDRHMTADELEVALRAMLGPHEVTGVAALSTVPSLLREMRLLLDRSELPSVVVGPGVRTGVPLLVDNPREVGADRVVNTLAAHRLFATACVVVDFGTSTNIDVVSAKGEFLGGVLAPGIEISMEALANRAAALQTVEIVRPRSVIGKNTVECLQSGVLYGNAAQVDGLVTRILAELGPGPVTVIGTGGLAPLMDGVSETISAYVPDLTLLGLRLAYLRNTDQPRTARSTVATSGRSNSPRVSGREPR
ncbi:type III pantothenate kinase [Pseudonocardia sp.]|uniref:type III pantothenate kinase n=1 Tax=Pseudonocardia sp. TaxID=60912 RepID=UPI003D1281A2